MTVLNCRSSLLHTPAIQPEQERQREHAKTSDHKRHPAAVAGKSETKCENAADDLTDKSNAPKKTKL